MTQDEFEVALRESRMFERRRFAHEITRELVRQHGANLEHYIPASGIGPFVVTIADQVSQALWRREEEDIANLR